MGDLIGCREAAYKKIATTFIASWTDGIDADMPRFLAQFSPTVEWHDHAFFIRHQGLGGMARFRTSWLTSIRDFGADITEVEVVNGGVMIKTVYRGTMVGPLPGRAPSGKSFRTHVLILLGIDDDGKIRKVDEYYTAIVDEGTDMDAYTLMGAGKHRGGVPNAGKL